jgi:hypothetical protein
VRAAVRASAPCGTGQRQWLERWSFLGESLVDDALGGRVNPRIGNRIKPAAELNIEIVEIAE